MDSNSSSTSLVIGVAAFGLALVATGVWLYRRNQAGSAAGGSVDEIEVETDAGGEEHIPGEDLPDDREAQKNIHSGASQKNQP